MKVQRLAIFPLTGAVLFPGLALPLHIFEPRYRAMVQDVLVRDRQIGMIQPRPRALADDERSDAVPADLFACGCVGHIADVEVLEDGRYNLVLAGTSRFRILRELPVSTPFRQVEAEIEAEGAGSAPLSSIERAGLEQEAKLFAERQGFLVDWDAVSRLDDQALVNGIAQVAPFDPAAKQALLEAASLRGRADLAVQMMQFFGRQSGPDTRPTLQ